MICCLKQGVERNVSLLSISSSSSRSRYQHSLVALLLDSELASRSFTNNVHHSPAPRSTFPPPFRDLRRQLEHQCSAAGHGTTRSHRLTQWGRFAHAPDPRRFSIRSIIQPARSDEIQLFELPDQRGQVQLLASYRLLGEQQRYQLHPFTHVEQGILYSREEFSKRLYSTVPRGIENDSWEPQCQERKL